MLSFLKNHPFAVEAYFESTLVLTYAVPKEELSGLIPECLEPDTFNDRWAFIAVAIVKTKNLRPKGFPKFMGNDFTLLGYRVFVRYHNNRGKRLRGLYILKSETNSAKMAFAGNIFTHYNYTATDINIEKKTNSILVHSSKSGISVEIEDIGPDVSLPATSPFNDWKEARRFTGPLPFTFSYNPDTRQVLTIEGVRQQWEPKPIHVVQDEILFIKQLPIKRVLLANAFIIEQVPYYWKKGKTEIWKQ